MYLILLPRSYFWNSARTRGWLKKAVCSRLKSGKDNVNWHCSSMWMCTHHQELQWHYPGKVGGFSSIVYHMKANRLSGKGEFPWEHYLWHHEKPTPRIYIVDKVDIVVEHLVSKCLFYLCRNRSKEQLELWAMKDWEKLLSETIIPFYT